jgi:hypothetical protein
LLKILRAHPCEGCLKGKMIRTAMTGKIEYYIDDKMDLWVFDTMIVLKETLGGCKYITTTMDVYTTKVFIGLHKTKSEIASYLIDLITRQQTQTGRTLKRLHSDNGTEVCTIEVSTFLTHQGTIHTTSTTYTPQHNSLVERKHRTIIEMARSCMHHAQASPKMYGEATFFAGHVLDRVTNSHHESMTPYERWNERKPDTSYLHVWGCDVSYIKHPNKRDHKFDVKSISGIFVGYDEHNETYYRILNVHTMNVERMRDVTFHENAFEQMTSIREIRSRHQLSY